MAALDPGAVRVLHIFLQGLIKEHRICMTATIRLPDHSHRCHVGCPVGRRVAVLNASTGDRATVFQRGGSLNPRYLAL